MDDRADDLGTNDELPLPGTKEPEARDAEPGDEADRDPTAGAGNVSVDEPTATSLEDPEGDGGADDGGGP